MMIFTLALRNLVHDRARLVATVVGLAFSVLLIGVQLGLYLGVRSMITSMIDNTAAQLWIVPFGAQSFDDSFPLLGNHERYQALATPGVERVIPLVVAFADWQRPDGGIAHIVVVGCDAEDGGLGPWNVSRGSWTDIKTTNGVGVDETYLSELGVTGVGSDAGIESHSVHVKALTDGIRSFTQAPYVFTTNARAREFFGVPEDKSTFLLVEPGPQADIALLQQELVGRLPGAEVLTTDEFRSRSLSRWLFRTGAGLALIGGAILGVVIGVAIEAQTLYSATLDHVREFAVLRILGSSASYVYRIILTQAIFISFAGFAVGTLSVVFVAQWSQQTALPMVVPPLLCVAMLVVALIIGAFSAITAVLKVLRIDPAAVLLR